MTHAIERIEFNDQAQPRPRNDSKRQRSSHLTTRRLGALSALTAAFGLLALAGCSAAPPDDNPEAELTASTEEALITRVIPIRFIQADGCTGSSCAPLRSFSDFQASVDRMNAIYADAGIKFWIKSFEHLGGAPSFAGNQGDYGTPPNNYVAPRVSWLSAYIQLHDAFPNMPSDAWLATDFKTGREWETAVASYFGDPNAITIFVHDESGDPRSMGDFPDGGRAVHLVAARMQDGNVTTTNLAHEVGHFLGLRHTFASLGGKDPSTQSPYTQGDRWDLLYCADGASPVFYTSKQDYETSPACTNLRVIERDGDCYAAADPTVGHLQCDIMGTTFYPGDSRLDGVTRDEPNILIHSPPTWYKYSVNVMTWFSEWGQAPGQHIDYGTPAFLSDSQLIKIDKNLNYDLDLPTGVDLDLTVL